MKKEDEYREIFLAEALDHYEELNRLMTELEKKPTDVPTINAIFRITHTLKGNAAGMGFGGIAELGHTVETLFGEIRDRRISLNPDIFTALFKAIDVLGALIRSLQDGSKVSYKGIKTKLEVICRAAAAPTADTAPVPASKKPRKSRKKATQPSSPSSTAPAETLPLEEESLPKSKSATPAEPKPEANPPKEEAAENKIVFSDLVQVPVRKLDNLLNLVGELIIERDRMMASDTERHRTNEYARLNRISSDLQYSVMDVRLVQVGFLFNKFHRVVRDAATQEKKQVTLTLEGTDTEIDRNILQIISDSLIHLIRNAVAHGIESPDVRKNHQKPAEGTITLKASNESDTVIIKIQDDGQGVDVERVRQRAVQRGLLTAEQAAQLSEEETVMLIFEPGFSTVEQVNAISGRGVGMDVVKKALDAIGGKIAVQTRAGEGTTVRLALPSSMAVKGTLLFEAGPTEYAIPLAYTEAVVSLYKPDIHPVGKGLVATYLGKTISVVFLKELFTLPQDDALPERAAATLAGPPASRTQARRDCGFLRQPNGGPGGRQTASAKGNCGETAHEAGGPGTLYQRRHHSGQRPRVPGAARTRYYQLHLSGKYALPNRSFIVTSKPNAVTCPKQRITEDLLKTGYAHAARSFSTLVNQPVSVELMSFALSGIGAINAIYYPEGDATLVLTDVMGEVGGRSHLLFSEPECVALQDLCLPKNCTAPQRASLGEAMLKEIDNILSAAMITKLSEALDLRIYGGVPRLFTLPTAEMKKKIKADMARPEDGGSLVTSARFLFENNPSLQPQFFWQFPPDFLQRLEAYLNSVL